MNMRNKRGSVLMLVVIFSLIVSLLGFAVIYMNGYEYLAVSRDLLDTRARLMADAGLELGREFLYYCDARLEDKDDLKIAEKAEPGAGSYRKAVYDAMQPFPGHGNAHGRKIGDGTYYLFTKKKIDNDSPSAWFDVWISSIANNMARTDGMYDYLISARGVATYKDGVAGAVSSVKDEELVIRMSSVVFTGAAPNPAWASWTDCTWASCPTRFRNQKHLPLGGRNMGGTPEANQTRYFFRYLRDAGRSFGEAPVAREVQ